MPSGSMMKTPRADWPLSSSTPYARETICFWSLASGNRRSPMWNSIQAMCEKTLSVLTPSSSALRSARVGTAASKASISLGQTKVKSAG
jgi:hypothetical protein